MRRPRGLQRASASVLIVGVVVVAGLTAGAEVSYLHTQKRLTTLQTSLTADALDVAPVDFERRLAQISEAVANGRDPAQIFRRLMGPNMRPAGPFASSSMVLLRLGRALPLAHLGSPPLRSLTGDAATAAFKLAARTGSLVTTRVVGDGIQRLGYLMAASGENGTFVVSGAQTLPIADVISTPKSSPDAGRNVALYFGRSIGPSSLVLSTTRHLPLSGTVSRTVIPFGTSVLTLVASPTSPLAGALSEVLPWVIALVGLVLTVGIAFLVERTLRRRQVAEKLAAENAMLFTQQREVAETLQRSFLPADLPEVPGVESAAVYLPSQRGSEVGGDWYSVVDSHDGRFTFVVGDVSGRGITAASTMAILRYTIRAYASLGLEPEAILNAANTELSFERTGQFATVLIGCAASRTNEIRLASAGHYRPILVTGDESTFVNVPIGPPLGVTDATYGSSVVSVPSGATVIAYTDGVFERRGETVDVGLERLRAAAGRESATVEERLKTIVSSLVGAGGEDDIALVGFRWQT